MSFRGFLSSYVHESYRDSVDAGGSSIHSQVSVSECDSMSRDFDEGEVDTEQPRVLTDSEISAGTEGYIGLLWMWDKVALRLIP